MSSSELYIGKTTKHAGQDFVWNGAKWVLFDPRKGPGVITIIGPEGPEGPAGAPGAPGAKGDPGEKGDAGSPGAAGQPGADGAKGDAGSPGAAGQPGADGAKGDKGDAGERGLQGLPGAKGDKGDPGEQGIQGIQGLQGLPGAKGDKGDPGEQGIQGIQGLQGLPGAKGDKGDPGEQGIQGIQGLPGLPGADGAKGDKGDPGEQGIQGIQGLPGADGVAGQDGSDGAPGTPGAPGAPGQGVPTGGSTGQILSKTGAGDFLTSWIDAPSGTVTAPAWHGHIHGAYAGGSAPALYEAMHFDLNSTLTTTNLGTSRIRLLRFYNPAAITVNNLRALSVTALSAGFSTFKFAIYDDALKKISSDITTNTITAGAWSFFQIGSAMNIALEAGKFYYIAMTCESGNAQTPIRCITHGSSNMLYNLSIPSVLTNYAQLTFHTATTTAGALPSTITLETTVIANLAGGFPALFLSST